jgi:hypothetical protein
MENLSHEYIEKLKQTHPALRLLNADNAPLVISFFYRIFIQTNRRSISYSELHSKLDDYLYQLQEVYGENLYPRSAKSYIEEWSSDNSEFLRQYYVAEADEAELDITPSVEKVIEWLLSLEQKQFIGAESLLLTMFQLLREIVQDTEQNPALRIAELERQKAVIEAEIDKVRAGTVNARDARHIKERFLQAEETARKLLSDFRQVEDNFRMLDRQAREKIAASEEQKGKLLDIIFQEQEVIQNSDQGQSFKAFWEFLMSPTSQDELKELLHKTFNVNEIKELNVNNILNQIDMTLLTAGEKVYKTSVLLAEQLRKYLETQAYLENRRIMDIIRKIEKQAIALKGCPPRTKEFSALNELNPDINLIMSRSMFLPPKNPVIAVDSLMEGKSDSILSALYQQTYVNEDELYSNIHQALKKHSQISLKELTLLFPVRKGLEEIITYLNIASKYPNTVINNDVQDCFILQNKKIQMPQIIFARK